MIELIVAVVSLVISSFHAVEAKKAREDQQKFYEYQKRMHKKIVDFMSNLENLLQLQRALQARGDFHGAAQVQALLSELNSAEKHQLLNSYLQSQDFCREMKMRYREIDILITRLSNDNVKKMPS